MALDNVGTKAETSSPVDFCRVLEASGCKWICFRRAKKSDSTVIGVSNGVDVWQQTHEPASSATDFTKLR